MSKNCRREPDVYVILGSTKMRLGLGKVDRRSTQEIGSDINDDMKSIDYNKMNSLNFENAVGYYEVSKSGKVVGQLMVVTSEEASIVSQVLFGNYTVLEDGSLEEDLNKFSILTRTYNLSLPGWKVDIGEWTPWAEISGGAGSLELGYSHDQAYYGDEGKSLADWKAKTPKILVDAGATATASGDSSKVVILIPSKNTDKNTNANLRIELPAATENNAGVLTPNLVTSINKILAANFPFEVESFEAIPAGPFPADSTQNITLRWRYLNTDNHPVASQRINDQEIDVTLREVVVENVTSTTTFTLAVTTETGVEVEVPLEVTFKSTPSFTGAVAANAEVTPELIASLKTLNLESREYQQFYALTNERVAYAYPAAFGELEDIRDGNGFDYYLGFTKYDLEIEGTMYYAYVLNEPTTAPRLKIIFS